MDKDNSMQVRMDNPPELPLNVSPDGSEIWEWAKNLGHWSSRMDEIQRLKNDLSRVNTCGCCAKWMTKSCPKERNRNGRNVGPSTGQHKCNEFVISYFESKRKERLETQLIELSTVVTNGAVRVEDTRGPA